MSKNILYLILSSLPFVFTKGNVFILNIICANIIPLHSFEFLSRLYISAVFISAPVVAAINNYLSTEVRKCDIVNLSVIFVSMCFSVLLVSLYCLATSQSLIFFFSVLIINLVTILGFGLNSIDLASLSDNKKTMKFFFPLLVSVSCVITSFFISSEFFKIVLILISYCSFSICVIFINAILNGKFFANFQVDFNFIDYNKLFYAYAIPLLGAPVLLFILNSASASDQYAFSVFNIGYQWFVIASLLPTLIAPASIRLMNNNVSFGSSFKRLSILITLAVCVLISTAVIALEFPLEVYPSYSGLNNIILSFVIASFFYVVYQSEINYRVANGQNTIAIIMVLSNSILLMFFFFSSFLDFSDVVIKISISMSLSYALAYLIIFFLGGRFAR